MPFWLVPLPHAVAVINEGGEIGSRRIVLLRGREGEGDLTLQVSARGPHAVTWTIVANTTPLANWAARQDITYLILPVPGGTQLTVTARYRRLLAPAMVFGP